jgi:hypothetical protein
MKREERVTIAQKIVELSSNRLSISENRRYIALKMGDGAYSNTATVGLRRNRVSFHVPSTELIGQANEAGLRPQSANARRLFFKHQQFFNGLTMSDVKKHEDLFRAITNDSLDWVLSQRPKTK